MRSLFIGLFFALAPAALASADHACNADRKLSDVLSAVHIARTNRLAALVQLGYEKNICFGLEAPDPTMLKETVQLGHSPVTIEAAIRQVLGNQYPYELSSRNGVILIRRSDGGTWLDHNVPSFVVPRTTVQWASMNLFMTVAMLADPSIGGFAGDFNPGDTNDHVGPFDEQNKRLWELLTLIVGTSRGGAWISGRCAVTDESITREPCWTILEYSLPLASTVAMAAGFLEKAKTNPKQGKFELSLKMITRNTSP